MIPTRIGQKNEGGYFAGLNRIQNCVYAILVAPKSTEHTNLEFKTHRGTTPGILSVNDGMANTLAMDDKLHPAAQYCRSLNVCGHTDYYLPSRDELELCYRNLKPTEYCNTILPVGARSGNLGLATGTNPNSIPVGAVYTATNPARTTVTVFQKGGVEAFTDWYWTSTEASTNTYNSLMQDFSDGAQLWTSKTTVFRVRGVRRIPINFE